MVAADRIGYPVVVKLYSHTITHKTDVGGVQLNLKDAAAVRQAYASIQASVTEKRGAEHFEGVTVQPMVNWTGYELISAARSTRSSGRSSSSGWAASSSSSSRTGPSASRR